MAGEEKGKDPGFGVRPEVRPEVRGAGGRLRPGLGAWQGRLGTAGPGYLRRRNFPVVLPASRSLPRGGNAAASAPASVGDGLGLRSR